MPRCKTCRHWQPAPLSHDAGYFEMRPLDTYRERNYGTCNGIDNHDTMRDDVEDVAFIPKDFDHMPLITHETFGCTLHEEK